MTLTVTHTTPADGTFSATGAAAWDANHALTVSGTSGQVQFNSSGDLAGDAGLTFDSTNKALTVGGGTVTASFPVLSASQTWQNAAVTFTALKLDVTDSGSNAASLLMDLRVGGSSQYRVTKAGKIEFLASTAGIGPNSSGGVGLVFYTDGAPTAGKFFMRGNGNIGQFIAGSLNSIGFASTSDPTNAGLNDTILTRKAAANLRFGNADAAAPVAQTLSVQSIVGGLTGTPNLSAAAYPLIIQGAQGTGTGAGGSIVFQVAPAGGSGSAQNAFVDVLKMDSTNRAITLTGKTYASGNFSFIPGQNSAAQSGMYMGSNPGGNYKYWVSDNTFYMGNSIIFGWASGLNINAENPPDLALARDAANTLAQRNGVNAQEFRVYETTTGNIYKALLGNRQLMKISGAAFADGAGASAGTLANAPAMGNPTKWIPIDDNGTTRYIPAW